jgi:hypothetical protein
VCVFSEAKSVRKLLISSVLSQQAVLLVWHNNGSQPGSVAYSIPAIQLEYEFVFLEVKVLRSLTTHLSNFPESPFH